MKVDFISEQLAWNEIVNGYARRDFFYSWDFHVNCASDAETPVLICLSVDNKNVFAMPMLRRELEDGLFDLVSVYGYTGPLCHSADQAAGLLDELFNELGKLGCVSGFSRMHPVIHETFPTHSAIFESGKTVSIACLPEEERYLQYRKTTRYEIRKLIKLGGTVEFTTTDQAFDQYAEIYYDTMKDLNAPPSYFFPRQWMRNILEIEGVAATVGTVHFEGEIISAALFTSVAGLAQYFLGGAKRDFSKLAPQKLLLHQASEWASQQDATLLHLGGGRGGREDGLFKFKAGFSKRVHPFRVMKFVCNQTKYEELTREHAKLNQMQETELIDSGFFPTYRAVLENQI